MSRYTVEDCSEEDLEQYIKQKEIKVRSKEPFSEETKFVAIAMFIGSLGVIAIAIAFGSIKVIIGAVVFVAPIIYGLMAMAKDNDRWR